MKEYIERERLKEALNADLQTLQSLDEHTMNLILLEIYEAPAADVAPVRHGRWIRPHWRNSVSCADCSECGAEAHHAEYRGVQKNYKICPACGALMDGKEGEGA